MKGFRTRRSCRVALSVPIRVSGIDHRGVVFTEDALTLIVSLRGAKIRLSHQLLPDSEIRLVAGSTGQGSVFRVVSKSPSSELKFTHWGVENLNPAENIWGTDMPDLQPEDQLQARLVLECPTCSARESLHADETLLAAIVEKGGVEYTCKVCQTRGFGKLLPYQVV